MVVALTMLLVALGLVLYRDRDFWFPTTQEADQPLQSAPAPVLATARRAEPAHQSSAHKGNPHREPIAQIAIDNSTPPATVTRTVLPPLEVEVVAGDSHRTVRPGTNSVHVDLQASETRAPSDSAAPAIDIASSLTTNAAEHSAIPSVSEEIVTSTVQPSYPMLARQMKVEGSVILQALIARDGNIQDLRVLSGPPILAHAAQEAVRQWHFKPHYEGSESVETQAKITVNFTISTN
jgi:TonB family protein